MLTGNLSNVHPSERVLLLPHCLRNAKKCRATSDENGLNCTQCTSGCQVNQLRAVAMQLGYRGVCIAPGGGLAQKYVKSKRPAAIVAVACDKELAMGIDQVFALAKQHKGPMPEIVTVPLRIEGCINTEVDLEAALDQLSVGCEMRKGA